MPISEKSINYCIVYIIDKTSIIFNWGINIKTTCNLGEGALSWTLDVSAANVIYFIYIYIYIIAYFQGQSGELAEVQISLHYLL